MKAFILLDSDNSFLSAHSSIRKAEAEAKTYGEIAPDDLTIREVDLETGQVIAHWDYDTSRGIYVCSSLNI